METSDYILYALLALIALLLGIVILVILRRNSAARRTEPPTSTPTHPVADTDSPESEEFVIEPLEKYLQHLDAVCQSVRGVERKRVRRAAHRLVAPLHDEAWQGTPSTTMRRMITDPY